MIVLFTNFNYLLTYAIWYAVVYNLAVANSIKASVAVVTNSRTLVHQFLSQSSEYLIDAVRHTVSHVLPRSFYPFSAAFAHTVAN